MLKAISISINNRILFKAVHGIAVLGLTTLVTQFPSLSCLMEYLASVLEVHLWVSTFNPGRRVCLNQLGAHTNPGGVPEEGLKPYEKINLMTT